MRAAPGTDGACEFAAAPDCAVYCAMGDVRPKEAMADVRRLLEQKPDAHGLTVPAMPVGSPGMEMGDRQDDYQVLLYGENGVKVFAEHP